MGIVAKLIMFVSAYITNKPNKSQRRVTLHEERGATREQKMEK